MERGDAIVVSTRDLAELTAQELNELLENYPKVTTTWSGEQR